MLCNVSRTVWLCYGDLLVCHLSLCGGGGGLDWFGLELGFDFFLWNSWNLLFMDLLTGISVIYYYQNVAEVVG